MPEYSSNTLIPTDATKVPGMQGSNAGNFQLDALKAYILAEKAQANGLASLDADGKLNSSQIPASLDDVLVYASYASLPATGETGKLYITSDVNGTYYWNGTSYQILNQSFVRYRGSVSSLPSDPQPGDWFIAASSFSAYTSGHIYLYNGSSWDDVTAVFGQFVLKTDIAQTIGNEVDKVPSNAAVNSAINAINGDISALIPKKMVFCSDLDANRYTDTTSLTVAFYYFSGSSTGTKPFGDGYLCELLYRLATGAYSTQIAIEDADYTIKIRHRDGNGDWVPWKTLTPQ